MFKASQSVTEAPKTKSR